MATSLTSATRVPRSLSVSVRRALSTALAGIDRPAWRRFFLALLGLALAFFLALFATALRETGRFGFSALVAAIALLLAGIVAVKTVPYLARRTALERWALKIEYQLTREGLIYLLMIAVIVVAALNTGNNLLFIVLASLLAGIVASGILSLVVLSGLELEFALPEHVFAGRPVASRLVIRNRKRLFPSFSITVSPVAPKSRRRESRAAAQASQVGTGGSGGGANPASGAWRRILFSPAFVPYVPRRSRVTRHPEIAFPRRGRYRQESFRISTKFPFGLLRKSREAPLRREIVALPSVEPTEEFYEILPLLSGELESFLKGRGHDLYAIRDYQEGDSARHVDWKATAKAQGLKVREFTREDERRVVLALDTRLPAADEKSLERFEKAVTFCACLAWHFYEINAQMQFVTAGFETRMERAAEIIYPTLEALAVVESRIAPGASRDVFSRIASDGSAFHIILTSRPRGSIPTHLWRSSYLVFFDSL